MEAYFNNLLQANLTLALLLLLYMILLRQVPQFQFNRFLLLSFLVVSIAIPFLPKPTAFEQKQVITSTQESPYFDGEMYIVPVENLTVTSNQEVRLVSAIDWFLTTKVIYWVGAIFFLVFFLVKIIQLIQFKKKAFQQRWRGDNAYFLTTLKGSFSFFNWIFLNEEWEQMDEYNKALIYEHESIHATQYHSLDLLFIELTKVLFWINPAIWILKKELQLQHEYYVDAVIQDKYDTSVYAELLLKLSRINRDKYIITSSISNFSTLKQRITMMTKSKSLIHKWRYFLLVPMLIVAFYACSTLDEDDIGITTIEKEKDNNPLTFYFNGELVDNSKGISIENIYQATDGNFNVWVDSNIPKIDSLRFTLAYNNFAIKSENVAVKKNEAKFTIKELPRKYFTIKNNIKQDLRLVVETFSEIQPKSSQIFVIPFYDKSKQQKSVELSTKELSAKELEALAKKIGQDQDVINFVKANHQLLDNFEKTGIKPTEDEFRKFDEAKTNYVNNVKLKYPEWDNLPKDQRNEVISSALKVASNIAKLNTEPRARYSNVTEPDYSKLFSTAKLASYSTIKTVEYNGKVVSKEGISFEEIVDKKGIIKFQFDDDISEIKRLDFKVSYLGSAFTSMTSYNLQKNHYSHNFQWLNRHATREELEMNIDKNIKIIVEVIFKDKFSEDLKKDIYAIPITKSA